ncbi:MAG: hypothetical protein E5X53_32960 [Mesorhizobium sp.]|uniref:hypothetical protein n=1 Tax=Mesorhizobium sp. TaxID=1871066 RepID=UPI000FE9DF0D|nr:hypothetical protein [Mesorhizobium sp.]RWM20417.1 MAG: hypothetical protein EOR73_15470 [Mesorhizobium sp.]TIP69374.1 MAG: hypothetical protein E5X55_32545 [Mesorhizobium sp.]TIQ03347.1 MAG: hypothetical protein E5X57_31075 [Mesorhizobium sp.]TIR47678.1 MAG: hypothetical protein E5X53_32960 [Mesorhizobium sp.]TJV93102.1 MAG: hypothetical protein E5X52_32340 [Mesorhizobium sp.]
MANWKCTTAAAVAAAAIGSLVLVKALPWVLGFAGGKYLYQMATDRTPTAAGISEQLQQQEFQLFRALKQELPEDYDKLVQKLVAVAKSRGGYEQVRDASMATVVDLRHRYASLLRSAPDGSASGALHAQLDMLNHVMTGESAVTCNRYVASGPIALTVNDHEMMAAMDKAAVALFHAIATAKNSGLPAVEAGDGDWEMLVTAFIAAGGTQGDMEAIVSSNQDYKDLCPAFAKLLEAALSVEGEPGRHIRTTLLYELASN